jgi:hypothetical protein
MRPVLLLLLSLALVPAYVGQTPVGAKYENLPGVVLYSHGYILSWDAQYTQVTVFGRDAKLFSAPEQISDSSPLMWAADSDGVVAGAYWTHRPQQGFIDLFDSTGHLTNRIHTGSDIPQQVAFAPDHTIWTAGFKAGNAPAQDFNVLHHYARSGEELGRALLYSQTGGDLKHPVIESLRGGQFLYVDNDRIGWDAALHAGARTWTEVSFQGVILGKYDLKTADGLALTTLAMTSSGNVYAKIFKPQSARFAVLDRSNGVWRKVVGDPQGRLLGSEGDDLVFANLNGSWTNLAFTPAGSLRLERTEG